MPINAASSPANPQKNRLTKIDKGVFFINRIDTLSPVTGYSWNKQGLVYSTDKGIFFASENTALISLPINTISWSHNGSSVFQSSSGWYHFNNTTATEIDIASLS